MHNKECDELHYLTPGKTTRLNRVKQFEYIQPVKNNV